MITLCEVVQWESSKFKHCSCGYFVSKPLFSWKVAQYAAKFECKQITIITEKDKVSYILWI